MARVAIVTDSTAMLPPSLGALEELITVVPLQVIIDGTSFDDGVPQTAPEALIEALSAKLSVTTSRPAPALLEEVYASLAAAGFTEIVSIHLSSELSATYESALLAARSSPVPVVALDTRVVGPQVGFAVLAAAAVAAAGGSAEEARAAAVDRLKAGSSYFYVDTLEYLRRGGRIGAAAALLGSALAVKPLLSLDDGRVVPYERLRTAERALARLEALALEAAASISDPGSGKGSVEVVVAHLGSPERAERLAASLSEELAERLSGDVRVGEVGAVLGAHVGPGLLAVVVAPAL